jgi:hypothetical protein
MMIRGRLPLFLFSIALLLSALHAQQAQAIFFNITITPSTITFPDLDPAVAPTIPADAAITMTLEVRGNPFAIWTMTAVSRGDLLSAGGSIPIANISWTAVKNSGTPGVVFHNGNLTAAVPGAIVVTGTGKESNASGTLSFFLQNSWDYAAGSYSQTTDFILASP